MSRMQQADVVFEQIRAADGPLSADEVRAAVKTAGGNVGLATVYRTIKKGIAAGTLREVVLNGVTRVEPADRGHHHHFVCDGCERVYDFHGCPGGLERLAPDGFRVRTHEIVLHGQCPACLEAA